MCDIYLYNHVESRVSIMNRSSCRSRVASQGALMFPSTCCRDVNMDIDIDVDIDIDIDVDVDVDISIHRRLQKVGIWA